MPLLRLKFTARHSRGSYQATHEVAFSISGPRMKLIHHRDEIVRAVRAGNSARIDQLAAQLAAAEEYKRLLQALGHCPDCAARAASNKPAPPKH